MLIDKTRNGKVKAMDKTKNRKSHGDGMEKTKTKIEKNQVDGQDQK